MKVTRWTLTLVFVMLVQGMAFAQSENLYLKVMVERLNNAKAYTLAMAEAMPEEHYGFKPVDEEMSFGNQLIHMAKNLTTISSRYITPAPINFPQDAEAGNKAAVLAMLSQSWDYAIAIVKDLDEKALADKVKFFAGEKTKLQMVNLLNDHQAHHRGQIAVYLRLNKVKPPQYIGW